MFMLVIYQPAFPSIWAAVQSLRRGLSTNPGVTMWCVFAMYLGVVAILLFNVLDVFSVCCSALLDKPCMVF